MTGDAAIGPLEPIGPDIWLAEGDCVDFYGFAYPTRMVVVRLASGGLWVWSPVALTPDLREGIEALETPHHLVSPNRIHHLFLTDWHATWPDVRIWGPDASIAKRPDLTFAPALTGTPPPEWRGEIDQILFDGPRLLTEVIFFHRNSRTAILADMSENFSEDFLRRHWSFWQRPIARLWGIVEGRGLAPLEIRLSTRDRARMRRLRDEMLGWDPRRVVMAHGVWQPEGGRAYLERAFAWV